MKTYVAENQIRIVGKGYEVRWKLKKLAASAPNPHAPLSSLLNGLNRRS